MLPPNEPGDLAPLVYDELRRLARSYLRRERPDHTLQPTALVHEAFLRLAAEDENRWRDQDHFIAVAATAMRRILVNHAHGHRSLKRGGGAHKVALFEAASVFEERAEDLLALDGALERLARVDALKSSIVELRFFAGLDVKETARILDVSTRTVERGWRFAKAWIRREIEAAA